MPNQEPKRDIAADREALAELHWGGWYEPLPLASFAEKTLPHYLTRTEEAESALSHERRKVEAAIEFLHRSNCPPGYRDVMGGCEKLIALRAKHGFDCAEEARLCRKCWDDYLDEKAKEAVPMLNRRAQPNTALLAGYRGR